MRLRVVEQVPGSGKSNKRRLVRIDQVRLRTLDDGGSCSRHRRKHVLARDLSSRPFTRATPKVDDCRSGGGKLSRRRSCVGLVSGAVLQDWRRA
jgi:hypothetical protein